MSGEFSADEVVGFGSARPRRRPFVWLRRHPAVLASIVAVAVVVGVVVLIQYVRAGPQLPALSRATATSLPRGDAGNLVAWDQGEDGRPVGPVRLAVPVVLQFTHVGSNGVQVLGLTGPGVTPARTPVAQLAPGATTMRTTLHSDVDCTAVTLPVAANSYGVRVRVADGSRRVDGTLPATALSGAWASQVQNACGPWLARHDLTVTAAPAKVAPIATSASLVLTVKNAGAHAAVARLVPSAFGGGIHATSSPSGTIPLAAGTSTQVPVTLSLRECDSVSSFDDTAAGTSTDLFGLYATAGTTVTDDAVSAEPDGFEPYGIVLAPAAAGSVLGALRSACGDIGPFVPLIPQQGVRYDPATRILTVPMVLDGTPGRVKDVQLVSTAAPPAALIPGSAPLQAVEKRTARLVPDRTGQIHTTLHYRSLNGRVCPVQGELIPGFTITARVPVSGGLRVLHYGSVFVPWEESPELLHLCPGANAD